MNDGCEVAITRTGWGPCHHFLVILCGLCTLAEATASLIVLVVSPLLACDLKYDKNNVMIINAISSLGMAFGAFLFGTLADTNGRKRSIPTSMVVIFCGSVVLSFAHKLLPISFAIFLLSVGVAGNHVGLRVYLVECLPAKRRGACLAMLDLLWVVGYLAALGISWSLVPSVVRMLGHEFRPSSWRVLAGLGGTPSLIMACVASLLPSSPRYLLYRRHPERAFAVLQQMYAVNNSRHVDQYPACELENCIRPDDNEDSESNSCLKTIQQYFTKTWKRIKTICGPPFTRTTILASVSRIFLFAGLMWLAAWKARISLRENEYFTVESTINTQHNSSNCTVDSGDIAQSFLHNCHEVNNAQFEYTLLISTSYILGEVLLVIGIDFVGRRLSIGSNVEFVRSIGDCSTAVRKDGNIMNTKIEITNAHAAVSENGTTLNDLTRDFCFTVTSGMVGGTAIFALLFVTRHATRILLSIFFLASYSIINTTIIIALLENYPTAVRGTVVGLTSVLPHLAAFFIKFFGKVYCEQSVYVATGLIIGAAIAAIPIPDLTRAPIRE